MNKSAIKNFAVNARRKLIDAVSQKAYGLGISIDEIKEIEQVPNGSRVKVDNEYVYLTTTETEHRERLIEQINYKGYEQVMEEVAYTWFNRIIAIRFMEVNEYLPTRVRVLSSEDENKVEPDAVTDALDLADELELDREKVYNYQDNNDTEGLFKYIFIKQCNALGKIMPVMFEKIQDYTELLLPDNLLVEGSVVRDLVSNIEEDDFMDQVEIIGWLYQYYISEKKKTVDEMLKKKNKKVTKENLPAKTQLFTPDWIVKYMVENSLGRLWLEGHPNDDLQKSWKYYLEEAEQEFDVEKEFEKIREESSKLTPEDITVLDPAMGSGHILVYAFDVLYQIYLSVGYSEREIPRLILEKNLYGIDIDDRAGQLAYFALIMKARSYSRRFFRDIERNPLKFNVCAIQESNELTNEDMEYFCDGDDELRRDVKYLVDVFTDAKEYGSILEIKSVNFDKIERRVVNLKECITDLFNRDNKDRILKTFSEIIKQGKIMSKKYEIMCTNPPYMGNKCMNDKLKNFLNLKFKFSKLDLFSVFMDLKKVYLKNNGFYSMINQHSWMFLSTFEELRESIIQNTTIYNMIHLGSRAFEEIGGEIVQSTAFVIRNTPQLRYNSKYVNLVDYKSSNLKKEMLFKFLHNHNNEINYQYIFKQSKFYKLPGKPLAYWVTDNMLKIYDESKILNEIGSPKTGMTTGNNDRFLRKWYEVFINNISLNSNDKYEAVNSNKKWFPYSKGGGFKKWKESNDTVINWFNDGYEIKNNTNKLGKKVASVRNEHMYFKECITYSSVSNSKFCARYVQKGGLFDSGGSCIFLDKDINIILGLLNSKIAELYLKIFNDTMNYQPGDIGRIPIKKIENKDIINNYVQECMSIVNTEFLYNEKFMAFKKHPLIEFKSNNIENSFENWNKFTEKQFNKLKLNEEELNKIFIKIYRLEDKLTPEVEDKDITIRKADRDREIKSFISYAVGCMMGRYSLDEEGLVFAGGEFDINKYKTFKADKDAIIPITDMEYFEDDIVSKFVEFVKIVFGEETLEENLNYIADTECFRRKSNETSRDCIRRYFLKGFMEDHLKVYQKRPIYWMFDSGKQNGFKALIYMHRYDENTVAKVRADYLHVLQRKYESEINRLDNDINSDILSTKEKTVAKKLKEKIQKQLAECKQYDQVIAHVAHQRIAIDLDDGVKVNYQKFQGVEVPQGDGKKDLKQDLLFKVKM